LQERSRLMFVGASRAGRQLVLIGSVADAAAGPRAGSLLATLWPGLDGCEKGTMSPDAEAKSVPPASAEEKTEAEAIDVTTPDFFELPLERLRFTDPIPQPPAILPLVAEEASGRPEFEWVQPAAVQIGTLIHRELQLLADWMAADASAIPARIDRQRYRRELALLGVEVEDLEQAASRVVDALERLAEDPIGRWILGPWAESWSEQRLSWRGSTRIEHLQYGQEYRTRNARAAE
jgi:hypothetical protein